MSDTPKIEISPTPDAVAHAAARRFVSLCERVLNEQETVAIGLAGGSTPKAMYELLASDFKNHVEWSRVELFFGDERTVPPDDDESNYKMAKTALLDHVIVPGDNVYRMKGELDPHDAAAAYDQLLLEKFGEDGGLDLLLLGMGDDAHTLSLFPGTAALDEHDKRCVANHVTQKDTWRITLTAPFANRSRETLALVTGANKAEALSNVLEGEDNPKQYPMQLIQPTLGRLVILADAAATGMVGEIE